MSEEDPNAALFGDDMASENEVMDYVFGKTPERVEAMTALYYQELIKQVEQMNLPDEEAKMMAVFKLATGSTIDMMADSQNAEDAPDMMNSFDMFLAVALTNKKYGINLFAEQEKALQSIDRSKFNSDEEYAEALSRAEDVWWEIAQPLLNGRNPNDAVRETMAEYGLTL